MIIDASQKRDRYYAQNEANQDTTAADDDEINGALNYVELTGAHRRKRNPEQDDGGTVVE